MRVMERRLKLFATDGDVPIIWILENECNGEIKSYCAKHDIKLELAPLGNNRTNRTERSIRTFKNHLLSMIVTAEKQLATLPLGRNLVPD